MLPRWGDALFMLMVVVMSTIGSVMNACIQSQRLTNVCAHSWCSFVNCANVALTSNPPGASSHPSHKFSTKCSFREASNTITEASSTSSSISSSTSSSTINQNVDGDAQSNVDAEMEEPIRLHNCPTGTLPTETQIAQVIGVDEYESTSCAIVPSMFDGQCSRVVPSGGRHVESILRPTASTQSYRSCGGWIDSMRSNTDFKSYTFNDDLRRRIYHRMNQLCAKTVDDFEDETLTPRIYYQLHGTCDVYRTLPDAQKLEEGELVVQSLMQYMGFRLEGSITRPRYEPSFQSPPDVARAVGVLTSFGCGSFVDSYVDMNSETVTLRPIIVNGELPSAEEMRDFGMDSFTISAFSTFRDYMGTLDTFFQTYDDQCGVDTLLTITAFINGMTHQEYRIDEFVAQQLSRQVTILMSLVCYYKIEPTQVQVLLLGACKVCMHRFVEQIDTFPYLSSTESMESTDSTTLSSSLNNEIVNEMAGPFRMRRTPSDVFEPPSRIELQLATHTSLSRLSKIDNAQISELNGLDPCFYTMTRMLPSLTERALHQLTITDSLVSKLEQVIESVRQAVVEVFSSQSLPIRASLKNADETIRLANTVRIYFKGAEDSSKYGDDPATVNVRFDDSRGFVMAVMNSVLERNVRLLNDAFLENNPCELPPIFELTVANAYYLTNANCIHVMYGLLQPPFADDSYSVNQLLKTFGFYIAHEISHTAHTYGVHPSSTFQAYDQPSIYTEAFADVVAFIAVFNSLPNNRDECLSLWNSVGQTFCSSQTITPTSQDTHPHGNYRVDKLWETVHRISRAYTCEL